MSILTLRGWQDCKNEKVFQSLYYWNEHFNKLHAKVANGVFYSFNPCIIGMSILTLSFFARLEAIPRFQSLYYWNEHFNIQLKNKAAQERMFQSLYYWNEHFNDRICKTVLLPGHSFNPCIIGMSILT
ncbi:MAG: hypothetical protein RL329_4204, partial [Bacteroidota bacterium]